MDWLKNRPFLQLLLNGLIMFLGLLIMFWIQKRDSSGETIIKDIETLKIEKADIEYVNKEIELHKEYDKDQDLKIETMRKEWREDQKEILQLIRGMK